MEINQQANAFPPQSTIFVYCSRSAQLIA